MHQPIACLNHRRVRKAIGRRRIVFQHQGGEPVGAVRRNRHIQRAAAFVVGSRADVVVINQKLSAVAQGYRIGAGIGIWQIHQRHLAPSLSIVCRMDLEKLVIMGPANGGERPILQKQNAGLDGSDVLAVIHGRCGCPSVPQIAGSLKMHFPAVAFSAAAAQDIAVGKLHRLVLDRA